MKHAGDIDKVDSQATFGSFNYAYTDRRPFFASIRAQFNHVTPSMGEFLRLQGVSCSLQQHLKSEVTCATMRNTITRDF